MKNDYFLTSLIGKSEEDAKKLCSENDFHYRVVREDSKHYMVTCDYRLDRVNIEIDNGIVTKFDIG